jgi:hypothetical protein
MVYFAWIWMLPPPMAVVGVGGIRSAYLVVVDNAVTIISVPYLDTELIRTAAACELTIDRGEQETDVPHHTIDRSNAPVLRPGS